nr:HetP family heterocyst commitment protein [Fortiea sp. LEGE XX443]
MPSSPKNFHSTITQEQLEQVINAISDGRYSWACVLILRFVGYNPLHFIPQRTYSRLMKEHSQFTDAKLDSQNKLQATVNSDDSQAEIQNFNNSNYLEPSDKKQENIQGANVPLYLQSNIATLYPSQENGLQN